MAYIELQFPFTGKTLPSDMATACMGKFRGLSRGSRCRWLAIETIPGTTRGNGVTQLDPEEASLKIRIPQDHVPLMLKLAGKRLEVDGHAIRLGAPQIYLLKPAAMLYARVVTIKGFTEPEPFLDAVCRKLDELCVKGEAVVGPRRVVKVGQHTIVGFGLAIHELSDEDSIILQEQGLGGRRRMGCGIFFPITQAPFEKGRPAVTKPNRLLAKSYSRKEYADAPPNYALLLQHSRDVAIACKSLARSIGQEFCVAQLRFGSGVDRGLPVRLHCQWLDSGFWAKATATFRRWYDFSHVNQTTYPSRSHLRPFDLDGVKNERLRKWVVANLDGVLVSAVWGAIGHHRKIPRAD